MFNHVKFIFKKQIYAPEPIYVESDGMVAHCLAVVVGFVPVAAVGWDLLWMSFWNVYTAKIAYTKKTSFVLLICWPYTKRNSKFKHSNRWYPFGGSSKKKHVYLWHNSGVSKYKLQLMNTLLLCQCFTHLGTKFSYTLCTEWISVLRRVNLRLHDSLTLMQKKVLRWYIQL